MRGKTLGGAALDSSWGLYHLSAKGYKLQILTEFVFVFQAQLEGIIAPKK